MNSMPFSHLPHPEMTMTLYHTLYRKLNVPIPTLPQVWEYVKSQVPGIMDLSLDLPSRDGEIITVAAITTNKTGPNTGPGYGGGELIRRVKPGKH
jgi:hypothetical protein